MRHLPHRRHINGLRARASLDVIPRVATGSTHANESGAWKSGGPVDTVPEGLHKGWTGDGEHDDGRGQVE